MKIEYLTKLPEDWQQIAEVFAALGDPFRQKMLLLFEAAEELSIKDIADVFPLSRTAVVHHLTVLERAGVLVMRRRGKSALYSVQAIEVLRAIEAVRDYILEEFPDVSNEL